MDHNRLFQPAEFLEIDGILSRRYPNTPLTRENSETSGAGHGKLILNNSSFEFGCMLTDIRPVGPGYRAVATPVRSAAMFDAALLNTGDSFVPM